jgi:hypothetical protein
MATGDSRLAGQATARLRYLWNDESGDGYQQGVLEFRDAATGHLKARARFTDASIAEIAEGTMVGRITGQHGRVLIADWRTTWHDNGAVTAEIGGIAADGRLPAVLVGGHCTGRFTRLEGDFPPPPEGSRTRSENVDKRAGWLPE